MYYVFPFFTLYNNIINRVLIDTFIHWAGAFTFKFFRQRRQQRKKKKNAPINIEVNRQRFFSIRRRHLKKAITYTNLHAQRYDGGCCLFCAVVVIILLKTF